MGPGPIGENGPFTNIMRLLCHAGNPPIFPGQRTNAKHGTDEGEKYKVVKIAITKRNTNIAPGQTPNCYFTEAISTAIPRFRFFSRGLFRGITPWFALLYAFILVLPTLPRWFLSRWKKYAPHGTEWAQIPHQSKWACLF